jgi:hypothetical protein
VCSSDLLGASNFGKSLIANILFISNFVMVYCSGAMELGMVNQRGLPCPFFFKKLSHTVSVNTADVVVAGKKY